LKIGEGVFGWFGFEQIAGRHLDPSHDQKCSSILHGR
jgi:hypothetical protein